jgi:hypothetical protein
MELVLIGMIFKNYRRRLLTLPGLWDSMIWVIRMISRLRGWNIDLLKHVFPSVAHAEISLGVISRPRTDEQQKSNSILGFNSRRKDEDEDDSDYD